VRRHGLGGTGTPDLHEKSARRPGPKAFVELGEADARSGYTGDTPHRGSASALGSALPA
jgi:hypothetical protein